MTTDLSRYIVNPGPKVPVSGLTAAVSTDSAIVTETMVNVLKSGGAMPRMGALPERSCRQLSSPS